MSNPCVMGSWPANMLDLQKAHESQRSICRPAERASRFAADGVAGLSIADSQKGGSDPAALPASALPARRERRPYSEFVQDPALTKAFQEADAAESAAAGVHILPSLLRGHATTGHCNMLPMCT